MTSTPLLTGATRLLELRKQKRQAIANLKATLSRFPEAASDPGVADAIAQVLQAFKLPVDP